MKRRVKKQAQKYHFEDLKGKGVDNALVTVDGQGEPALEQQSIAATAISTVAHPVMAIIGNCGSNWLMLLTNSNPSAPEVVSR